jgi:hypothetical protein
MIESAAHVRIIEETSANWRVLFENPPFNIVDATIFEGLQRHIQSPHRLSSRYSRACSLMSIDTNPLSGLATTGANDVRSRL